MNSLSPFVINATPELVLPPDVTIEAANASGAVASDLRRPSMRKIDPAPNCTPVSGQHAVPLGATVVACSTSDASGLTETGSFNVTVVDTTPPVVTAPATDHVTATLSGGASGASSAALAQWLGGATAVEQ